MTLNKFTIIIEIKKTLVLVFFGSKKSSHKMKWFFLVAYWKNFLKKAKKRRLKNFPAGYVGNFYRNLADNVDNFIGSDFY